MTAVSSDSHPIHTDYCGHGEWLAYRGDWDLGVPYGTGNSEASAIEDLINQEEHMHILTITPAYGRDYTSEADAKRAWASGADFQIMEVRGLSAGGYVNNQQLEELRAGGIRWLNIRYKSLSRVAVVKV